MKFNLTSSFRSDSDLPIPYLYTQRRDKPCNECLPNTTILNEKGKNLMVWLVSNCNTRGKREKYFSCLSRYISADKFGRCGQRISCNRKTMKTKCTRNVMKKYKFYFSAENALCKDYITGKINGRLSLRFSLLPV